MCHFRIEAHSLRFTVEVLSWAGLVRYRRSASVNRNRFFPTRSIRARFTALGYSI